jgi:phosphosulfolactate synthase (CoM biosynthesis protein A)
MTPKQTAVGQFWQDLQDIQDILPLSVDIETGIKLIRALNQAKTMEKQQIIEFADKYDAYVVQGGTLTAKQYYNETFNK